MKRLMLTICALMALSASAETRTWLANVDGNWNTPGMWSGGAVPGSGDTADFSNLTGDKTITLPAAVTVGSIVYSPPVGSTTNKLAFAGSAISVTTSITVGEKAQLRTTCDVKATGNLYTYGLGEWVVAQSLKGDNGNKRILYQCAGRITLPSGATMGYGINLYPGTVDTSLPPAEFVVEEGAIVNFDKVNDFQIAQSANSRAVLTVNGGTILPRNALNGGCFLVGLETGGYGEMNIKGGEIDGTGKTFYYGFRGTGVVNQTAGVMKWNTVNGTLNASSPPGTYNLLGGEVWVAAAFSRNGGTAYLNVGNGKIVKTGTGILDVTSPLTIAERFEIDVTNAAYTCSIPSSMTGAGGLVKTGPGVLNLYSAEKSFSGPFVVSNGTVLADVNMPGGNAVTVAGGTLKMYHNRPYTFSSLTICGTGTLLTTNTATVKLPPNANFVTIEDDGVLVFGEGRNPFVTNPALQINGNGKVRIPAGVMLWFPSVKNGPEYMPNGVYTSATSDIVDGGGTLVVGNYAWNGTAGNDLWSASANWQGGMSPFVGMGGVDLSAATGTLTLDAAVTNAALVYAPAGGATLTNRSTAVLSLCEGAIVTVGSESTLVLDGDACLLSGNVYKRGGGTLIFARKLLAGTVETIPSVYLRVQEGTCVLEGSVTNVSLTAGMWSGSALTDTPEIIFGQNSTLSGATYLSGVGNDASVDPAPGNGRFTQLGGTVRPISSWGGAAAMALVRSGQAAATGTYHLVDGVFEIPASKVMTLSDAPSFGIFMQDGGESRIAQLGWSNSSGSRGEVALNGGLMMIGTLGGNVAQFSFAGGTFAPLYAKLTVGNAWSLLGSTTFNATSGVSLAFSQAPSGVGALVKTGAGALTLPGGITQNNDLTVTEGVLALGASSVIGNLSLTSVASVNLVGVNSATNFSLGGAVQPADGATYTSNNCSVIRGDGVLIVGGVPGKWNGHAGDLRWGTTGNWSGGVIPNGAAIAADLSTASGTLTFDAGNLVVGGLVYAADGAMTLTNAAPSGSEGNILSLAANGVITVGDGETLVLDHPLCMQGQDAYKRGKGTLVLRQGMCAVASRALSDNYFNIEEGIVVNEGCVTNVCPVPGAKDRSDSTNVPQFINRGGDASVVGNTFISAMHFRAKSGDENVTSPGNGLFTQDGGEVSPNMTWIVQGQIGFAPAGVAAGGTGTYHLVRGTLRIPSGKSFNMHGNNGFGIFTQDDGLFEHNGSFDMGNGIVTLNGGTMRLNTIVNPQPITISGGTFRPLPASFTFPSGFNLTGEGVFEIDEGKTMTLNAANPLRGNAPLNKGGDGTLVITGSGAGLTGAVNVNGGTLRLTGCLPNSTNMAVAAGATLEIATGTAAFNAQTVLSVARDGKLNLTGTGSVSVDALWLDGLPKFGHGRRYGSSGHTGEVDIVDDRFFSGTGVLVVTGCSVGEGTMIIFR